MVISHLERVVYVLIMVLALFTVGVCAYKSESLSAVSIKLKAGQSDRYDTPIPFLSHKGDELPDYKVQYRKNERWNTVGTIHNRSAAQWLKFGVADEPSVSLVQGIRILEDDSLNDELLDEVQVTAMELNGTVFDIRIETDYSFKAGMDWFASTPFGFAILGGLAFAVFLGVFSFLDA